MARGALGDVLEGALGGGRVTADASGLGDLVLRPELVRAVLLGAMLGAEALPRGGVVRIAGMPGEVAIHPDGRNAAWPPALFAALAGEEVSGARNVLAPLPVAVCARGRTRRCPADADHDRLIEGSAARNRATRRVRPRLPSGPGARPHGARFPPSVFAGLPRLLERVGPGPEGCVGSTTAILTVLVEGDDHD